MPVKNVKKLWKNRRKGQGMVEYALLVSGIALVCIIGVSLIGEKTGDMLDLVAVVLPGADSDDNAAIGQGHLIEDTNTNGVLQIDTSAISSRSTSGGGLGQNLVGANVGNDGMKLIVDPVIQNGGS